MTNRDKKLSGKKILMVLDAPYPSDLRLEKEIPTLVKAGAEITLLCYRRPGEKKAEEMNGFNVVRTEKPVNKRTKGLMDIYNSLFFSNIYLARELEKLSPPDVVHVHDLAPAGTVDRWARKNGIKTILDLHENYPEALKVWFKWRKNVLIRLKNKAFFRYGTWLKREKQMCQKYDRVIAVIDEMKERLSSIHSVASDKILVVANTELKNSQEKIQKHSSKNELKQIVYVGGIGPHRGLQTAIEGMSYIRDIPELHLKIVGSGNSDTIATLQEIMRKLGLEKVVEFTGRVPFEEALGYMNGAFLNIIPHLKNNHTDNTIPHKLFQIMNSGYPLLVSSCDPLKRIVTEEKCGLVFEANNPNDFAEKVRFALKSPDLISGFTRNGKKAVQKGRWNWEFDSKELLNLYRELL